jgi:hypothetical protein
MTNVGRFRCIWLCCSSLLNQSSSNCCFACAALPLSMELQGPATVDAGSAREPALSFWMSLMARQLTCISINGNKGFV